ncbi:MAG: extracellular solute-binding protein, partial [Butyrivibrio sp.]|nr:extracellular solute-binding protein [Butyrivibrio sp.]
VTDAFNASQEYITVEPVYIGGYPVIKEQIAAAQAARDGLPGLSTINYPQVITYADSGVAEPLDGYVDAYDVNVNVFYQGFTDPVTVDGQLYAFPYGPSATYIFYNRDLLKEGGLDHYPETWAELKEVAPAFHEATGKPLLSLWGGSTGFNTINSFLIQTGVDPLGDGTTARVDDPAIVQWVRDVKELVDNGGAEWIDTGNNTETDLKTKFLAGEAVSIPYSNTYYDLVLKDAGFDVGLALYPENANRHVTTAGATLFIPALNDQAVKNAAFQFLTYITNDENAKQFALDSAYLPTRRTILEDEDSVAAFTALYPDDEVIFAHMDDIIPKNSSPYFTPALTEIVEELTQIFNNGADIDETIARTTDNVNYILSGN